MDDVAVALIFVVISLVGWGMKKAREAGNKTATKPESMELDIGSDSPELILEEADGRVKEKMGEAFIAGNPVADELRGSTSSAEPIRVDEPASSPMLPSATAANSTSRMLAGIRLDAKGARQGIVLSEVLGKPKHLR